MKLTSAEAFELAVVFRDAAIAVGDTKIKNWDAMTPKQRKDLEDAEWSLLNAASDMVTMAVGLVLDETQFALARLTGVVGSARKALKRLDDIRKAIKVATALVGLAAAVITRDFGAIAKSAQGVADAIDLGSLGITLPKLPV
ncbi:MAG: hypothetical protein IT561_16725 [Alphaproteobacteria bacterium]|nr:hypothetical protein [Alphaproteobacteria bacterium]